MKKDNLNILFVHFPVDNNRIESKTLPDYFVERGHRVHSIFEKTNNKNRHFYSLHKGLNKPVTKINKEDLEKENFDLIISVGAGYQAYGMKFKSKNTKVINSMPMMLSKNIENVDSYFIDNWIIKAPPENMQNIFKENYIPYNKRKNRLLIPASIGGWKNQREIINFLTPEKMGKDFFVHFAGTVQSVNELNYLKKACEAKNINAEFGHYTWDELAHLYLDSKLVCLSSDPRPGQSCDPCPRVIFEALCAGTPCLVNNLVLIHEYARMFTRVYNVGDKDDFNEKINAMLDMNLNDMSKIYHKEYSKVFSMNYACNFAYDRIIKKYLSLKHSV